MSIRFVINNCGVKMAVPSQTRYYMTATNTIRLMNLPRVATTTDVRHLFWRMFIPEGGVQITGGEYGEAYVTFSTDEDAVRALHLDGGRIKDIPIRLLPCVPGETKKVAQYIRRKIQEAEEGERLKPIDIEKHLSLILEPVVQSMTSPAVHKLPTEETRTTARPRVRQISSTRFNRLRLPAAVPYTTRRPLV